MRNKEAKAAYQREWLKRNPEKMAAYRKKSKEINRARYMEASRAYQALRRQDPDKRATMLESTQQWRLKEKARDYENWQAKTRDSRLRHTFGITLAEYDKMLLEQGGVCKICKRPPKKHRLSVDHDHKYKGDKRDSVRGLLCPSCNRGLAWFQDNAERLRNAALYLEGGGANPIAT